MPHHFENSYAKIARAKKQIATLDAEIVNFLDGCKIEKARETAEGNTEIWSFRLNKAVPAELSVIAGEILFNLRSSLDILMCEVASIHDTSTNGIYFPFGNDKEHLEQQIGQKIKKLPESVKELIRSLSPHKSGDRVLWELHDLNRRDKHLTLLPVMSTCRIYFSSAVTIKGELLTIGPRWGRHLYFDGTDLIQPDPDKQPRIVSNGHVETYDGSTVMDFGFIPPDEISNKCCFVAKLNDQTGSPNRSSFGYANTHTEFSNQLSMEYSTTTEGSEVALEVYPVVNISFGDVDDLPIKLTPVTQLLNKLQRKCCSIVDRFVQILKQG